ncbi:hypothetical protein vseg_018917 [Gypsophila vaccaria]
MKDLIGKLVRKKEQSSSSSSSSPSAPPRYRKLTREYKQEIRRGYVPIMVGKYEEEEEKFMVPTKLMTHSCIVALLQLSIDEFGYSHEGVLHIPCEPLFFRETLEHISFKK